MRWNESAITELSTGMLSFARDESGGSILYAIFLTTYLAVFAGLLITMDLIARSGIANNLREEQLYYDSESGVAIGMARLQAEQHPVDLDVLLDSSTRRASVSVDALGGFFRINSEVRDHRTTCSSLAIAGSQSSTIDSVAVHLTDSEKRLFVSGSTIIKGDIYLSDGSLERGSIDGHRFSGSVDGDVHGNSGNLVKATFPLFKESVSVFESLLADFSFDSVSTYSGISDGNVVYLNAPATIDSTWFSDGTPLTIISDSDITLTETGWIPNGSIFLSSRSLTVTRGTQSDQSVFYGRESVSISEASLSGQFMSLQSIGVDSLSWLRYPSSIYVSGSPEIAQVIFEDGSRFDGTVIFESTETPRTPRLGNIVVRHGATVRGAVFNSAATELSGNLFGTIQTKQFYFYQSPSVYVNWLNNTHVDVSRRPEHFVLPASNDLLPTLLQINTTCTRI